MYWKLITSGKFYASGLVKFDNTLGQFKDARDMGINDMPAMFSLKKLLNIDSDAEIIHDLLLSQFDRAVTFLLSADRDYLLDKFNQAYNKYKELHNSNPTTGFVVVSPEGTFANYVSNSLAFVYVISDQHDDTWSSNIKTVNRASGDTSSYVYYIFDGVSSNE